jgi:enterochelin esterase-like enzyme
MRFRKSIAIITIVIVVNTLFGCNNSTTSIEDNINTKVSDSTVSNNVETKLTKSELKKVTLSSKVLNQDMKLNIYLPKGYSTVDKYPVLYMIHGYSGNEDSWMPDCKLDKKADELIDNNRIKPLIIVAPQIDNSYGLNSSETPKKLGDDRKYSLNEGLYEDYLCKEAVTFIDSNYSTISSKAGRYIGGLSMGGCVALHLAFSHSDMFSKVGGHSPALFINEFPIGLEQWLYPNERLREERDPIYIAQNKAPEALKVYLDCGDKDSYKFYEGCDKLYKILQSKGVESQYHLNSGAHDGAYWEGNAEKYLLFYAGR